MMAGPYRVNYQIQSTVAALVWDLGAVNSSLQPQMVFEVPCSRDGEQVQVIGPESSSEPWVVSPDQVPARWEMRLRTGGVLPVLRAWADPDLSEAQRHTALADLATRWWRAQDLTPPPPTGARRAFARRDPATSTLVFPHRTDGRFAFAGFTEPYPGAWPTDAVLAAERGDLSALWPLLGSADGPQR